MGSQDYLTSLILPRDVGMSTTDMVSNINNTNVVDKSYSWYIAPMVLRYPTLPM